MQIDPESQPGSTSTDSLCPQTWTKYERISRLHILPIIGGESVEGLTTPMCEKAIHGLYDKTAGKGFRTAALAK